MLFSLWSLELLLTPAWAKQSVWLKENCTVLKHKQETFLCSRCINHYEAAAAWYKFMIHANVGGIASVIYTAKEYASPRLSHRVCRHICVCHVCMLLCFWAVMTQLYIQETQALILAVTLIWNTISTVCLCRRVTLIHLLTCETPPGCCWWARRVCFEPFCSPFITPSRTLCPFIVNRAHFIFIERQLLHPIVLIACRSHLLRVLWKSASPTAQQKHYQSSPS